MLGKGWVAAGDLVSGDEVYNLDGTIAVVTDSELEKLDTPILVYNLEVEDYHSYFVGDASVLVHNYERGEPLNDNDYVVRGGLSTPDNLSANQSMDPRGHISANGGSDFNTIASYGTNGSGFKNGQLSVTTVADIRNLGSGWDVIADPNNNPYHVSIVPPNCSTLSSDDAMLLSKLFEHRTNDWK